MNISGILGRVSPEAQRPLELDISDSLIGDSPGNVSADLRAPGLSVSAYAGWTAAEDGVFCAISGNVDWLDVELADLQLKRDPAQALLHAYKRHGLKLLTAVGGRFSAFVWDSPQRSGLVACDRFGQSPVYWAHAENGDLVFGPLATVVSEMSGGPRRLSDQSIFNFFYFHMVPGPETIFEGVHKLCAAHTLIADRGEWHVERYWHPDFRENADESQSDAAEEMLGLLSSSVGRLADGADTGAFLSGGLDSSTVAGLLARLQPNPDTYSIGFDAEGYDETGFAKIASDRFKTTFNTYYVTPEDVLSALPKIAAAYDEPFGNSSALPAYFCARFAAADGRERLLAGDGGDELFAGNERYSKQTIFERYNDIPSVGRRFLIEPLLFKFLPEATPLLGKARSYVTQANVPLPDRLQIYNFLNRLGAQSIVTEELWASVNTKKPLDLDRELYQSPDSASRLNRMLYLDWHHTLADNDIRKVTRMCELAGIQVEYPMLDDRLVEFSTRVSSARKMRGNRLRDFYKRAVADLLPREIIDKPKHGFGLPFGVWMAEHAGLQELAGDNLARMKRRGYVKPAFVDEIVRLHRDQHAGYYGEFIWVLIMLEMWLTAQGIEP